MNSIYRLFFLYIFIWQLMRIFSYHQQHKSSNQQPTSPRVCVPDSRNNALKMGSPSNNYYKPVSSPKVSIAFSNSNINSPYNNHQPQKPQTSYSNFKQPQNQFPSHNPNNRAYNNKNEAQSFIRPSQQYQPTYTYPLNTPKSPSNCSTPRDLLKSISSPNFDMTHRRTFTDSFSTLKKQKSKKDIHSISNKQEKHENNKIIKIENRYQQYNTEQYRRQQSDQHHRYGKYEGERVLLTDRSNLTERCQRMGKQWDKYQMQKYQIKVLITQVNQLRKKFGNFYKKYGQLVSQMEKVSANNMKKNSQVKELQDILGHKDIEIKRCKEEISELATKYDNLQKIKNKTITDNQQLATKLSIIQNCNNQLITINSDLKKQIKDLQHENANKSTRIQQLQSQLQIQSRSNSNSNNSQQKMSIGNCHTLSISCTIQKTDQKISTQPQISQCNHNEINQQLINIIQQIKQINKLTIIKTQKNNNNINNNNKFSTIIQEEEQQQQLSSSINTINQNNNNDNSSNNKYDNEKYKQYCTAINNQLNTLSIQLNNKEITIKKLMKKIEKLETDHKTDHEKDKKYNAKIKELEQSVDMLQKQFVSQLSVMKQTLGHNQELEDENECLRGQIQELEEQVQKMKLKMEEQDKSRQEQQIKQEGQSRQKIYRIHKKSVTWAHTNCLNCKQTNEYQEQDKQNLSNNHQQQKNEIKSTKSLKQLQQMLQLQSFNDHSTTTIAQEQSININRSILVYICNILDISTKNSTISDTPAKNNQKQTQKQQNMQTQLQAEILLQNIINYLQNNKNSFMTHRPYCQILNLLNQQLENYNSNQPKQQPIIITNNNNKVQNTFHTKHQKLMNLLKYYQQNSNKSLKYQQIFKQQDRVIRNLQEIQYRKSVQYQIITGRQGKCIWDNNQIIYGQNQKIMAMGLKNLNIKYQNIMEQQ